MVAKRFSKRHPLEAEELWQEGLRCYIEIVRDFPGKTKHAKAFDAAAIDFCSFSVGRKRTDEKEVLLAEIAELLPPLSNFHTIRVELLTAQTNPDDVIRILTSAIQASPTVPVYYCARANRYITSGNRDAAMADLNRLAHLVRKNPSQQDSIKWIAQSFSKNDEHGEWLLTAWIEQFPEESQSLSLQFNVALVLNRQAKYGEAANLLTQYLNRRRNSGEEDQQSINARNQLAISYREQALLEDWEGVERENLEVKRRVLGEEHSDTKFSRGQLGVILRRKAQQEAEKDDWGAVVEILTSDSEVDADQRYYEALVLAFLLSGDVENAKKTCDIIWEKYRGSKDNGEQAGVVRICCIPPECHMDTADLLKVATKARTSDPLPYGLALYRAGRFAESLEAIPATHSSPWKRPTAAFYRAMALQQTSRVDEARAELEKAIALMNSIAPTAGPGIERYSRRELWTLNALYRILQSEAEALIGKPQSSVPGSKSPERAVLRPGR